MVSGRWNRTSRDTWNIYFAPNQISYSCYLSQGWQRLAAEVSPSNPTAEGRYISHLTAKAVLNTDSNKIRIFLETNFKAHIGFLFH